MTTTYWKQWDYSEIISMHQLDAKEDHAEECDPNDDEEKVCSVIHDCPRCSDHGCRYCLMLE